MKKVTIPTCANPFVVIVNGIKYTYPAGETVEVPDDVAEVIEQHEEAKPEPAPVLPPFAPVPSEDKSEFEVVTITTDVGNGIMLTESESAALNAAWEKGSPVIINCNIDFGTNAMRIDNVSGIAMIGLMTRAKNGQACEMRVFGMPFGSTIIMFADMSPVGYGDRWIANLEST